MFTPIERSNSRSSKLPTKVAAGSLNNSSIFYDIDNIIWKLLVLLVTSSGRINTAISAYIVVTFLVLAIVPLLLVLSNVVISGLLLVLLSLFFFLTVTPHVS